MRLGILGGGQLARMLALAAYPLAINTVCFDTDSTACAGEVTELITADFTDTSALDQFLATVDCITFETENIPLACANYIASKKPVYPSLTALEITQDRGHEKSFLASLTIPTASFICVDTQAQLVQAVAELGLPAILKTRRFGYDGKGQCVIRSEQDISNSYDRLQTQSLIVEQLVTFECELSIIAVRNKHGDTVFYPLVRNHHEQGILRFSEAPFDNPALQEAAQDYAIKILNKLQYVGVITIEFFYDGNQLIVNEIAPRVHNSGHWTIEGAYTSQFENHLRALFDLPLGSTKQMGHCLLINCIGDMLPATSCLSVPGTHYHAYGKSPRPGRKLGHVNLVEADESCYIKSKEILNNILL